MQVLVTTGAPDKGAGLPFEEDQSVETPAPAQLLPHRKMSIHETDPVLRLMRDRALF
jgi:hypothetical protein